jgi:hypothetical protein
MKTLFCYITVVFFFASVLNAQDYVPTPAEISHFSETKTMIVLENSPISEYNLTIREFVTDGWKLTPFEFLELKEFDKNRKNPELSFLRLNDVKFEKDKTNAKYIFISLLLGDKNAKKISEMPDMCPFPLASVGAPEETYVYKVEVLLRFIQNHVNVISEKPKLAAKNNPVKTYSSNLQSLNGKTLYLLADDLDKKVKTEADIQKIYKGAVKLVTKDELEQAIKNKTADVVFLHKVGPIKKSPNARCYKILVGVDDAQLYYFAYHKIDDKKANGFLEADFKTLAKKK